MDRIKHFARCISGKSLYVVLSLALVLTLLSEPARPQASEADKQKIVAKVAQDWIQAGITHYKRGHYKQAEQSFLRALYYKKYLSPSVRDKLNEHLEKTQRALLERDRITRHIQTADSLVKQGRIIEAKAYLEDVQGNESLTEQERKLVAEGLEKIEKRLNEQKGRFAKLYTQSVELFKAGQFEKAREGFVKIVENGFLEAPQGKTPEDYLAKIDNILADKIEPEISSEPAVVERFPEPAAVGIEDELLGTQPEPVVKQEQPASITVVESDMPGSIPQEGTYIEKINRRMSIIRGHTKAIVNDANDKARDYIDNEQLDKAEEVVETAQRAVIENQLQLGPYLYEQYSRKLMGLKEEILQKKIARDKVLGLLKVEQAKQAQESFRIRMEKDRKKRIDELMGNATSYKQQQRYEEALGQLKSLLAIDPLNDLALIEKDTLEDIIAFRKQLDLGTEFSRNRAELLLKTDESAIPHPEEMTYPKNWRELDAKRKPEKALLRDPANEAVYKQLEGIVDLSALTPGMSFGEALDVLKGSVDPPLIIVPMWRDLMVNGIEQTTTVDMPSIREIPLGTALELLLRSVSSELVEISYVVKNGVLTVATVELLPSELETEVYDVTILLGRPANFMQPVGQTGGFGGGGFGGGFGGGGGGYGGGGGGIGGGGGGYGGGGYGGGGGGYGGGGRGGGGGGYGGGGYGGGGYGGGGYGGEEDVEERKEALIELIQETIEPDSWFEAGGEGTIKFYETKKLIVRQTREVHNQIRKLLEDMRKALGHQVAIEVRFLIIGENFMEDIGVDVDFTINNLGKNWDPLEFTQTSAGTVVPDPTGVPGSLAGILPNLLLGKYGSLTTDLEVDFLVRAVQAHSDSTSLTAPKVTVISGESATISVQRIIAYALPPYTYGRERFSGASDTGAFVQNVVPREEFLPTGTVLNINPTITPDKKHVLLEIQTTFQAFLQFSFTQVETPVGTEGQVQTYNVKLPETETSQIMTRVNVPDGGTLLLGGQKITVESEKEAGVPILSKIPIIGRLFSNRSVIKDHKILLILVKPTIMLQEEADVEAVAAMERGFYF